MSRNKLRCSEEHLLKEESDAVKDIFRIIILRSGVEIKISVAVRITTEEITVSLESREKNSKREKLLRLHHTGVKQEPEFKKLLLERIKPSATKSG